MTVWLVLAVLTLVLPALGIGPIIRRSGRTAWNNALMVNLPPDSVTVEQGNSPAGRKAQEVVDWVHRWLGALVLTFPLVFFVPALAIIPAAFLATLWAKVFNAHFELVGHGAEIIVAGEDYRAGEIHRMMTRDSTFRGWTADEIDEGLRKREWLSRIFVRFYA